MDEIRQLDNYLFGVLRILRLSQLRRSARVATQSLASIEYDSAELALRMSDARAALQARDELRAVCRYACERKQSAKSGSVLILRFFHGYYPNEIAAILRSARKVVDMRLADARREAKQFLAVPQRSSSKVRTPMTKNSGNTEADFLHELRADIFRARQGSCFAPAALQQMYQATSGEALDHQQLSHLVSCPRCLEQVNEMLGLPALAERHPADTLGNAARRNSNDDDDENNSGAARLLKEARRRSQQWFEHRPLELHVAVNGLALGTHSIEAGWNEQTFELPQDEPPAFIEVFSEQGVRLLMLPIDELSGDGWDRFITCPTESQAPQPTQKPNAQTLCLELNEGRALELNLNQSTLRLRYYEPPSEPFIEIAPAKASSFAERMRAWLLGWEGWLRPALASLLLCAAGAALWWFVRSAPTKVSAAELLQKSVVAETQLAAQPKQAVHRTIRLETREAGKALTQRRIELWHSAQHGGTVRRVFDDAGRLLAGEWTRADGTRQLYAQAKSAVASESVWRTALTLPPFAAAVASSTATVEEQSARYVLRYELPPTGAAFAEGRLLQATLTLNRADLRAVAQTLLLAHDDQPPREYELTETNYELLPAEQVAPAVFNPEPELRQVIEPKAAPRAVESNTASAAAPRLAALEIEVRYLLDQVNANLGEQISFTRADGKLRLRALVETEARKTELLAALAPLRQQSAAHLEVLTYAEAARNQTAPAARPTAVTEISASSNQIAAAAELRRHLKTNDETQLAQFAARMQAQAAQPVRHAWALKRLAEQLAPAELATLQPAAKAKWRKLIVTHAAALQREAAALRRELQPVFFAGVTEAEPEVASSDLRALAAQLVELTAAQDDAIGRALSSAGTDTNVTPLRTRQFWQGLRRVEMLAAQMLKQD